MLEQEPKGMSLSIQTRKLAPASQKPQLNPVLFVIGITLVVWIVMAIAVRYQYVDLSLQVPTWQIMNLVGSSLGTAINWTMGVGGVVALLALSRRQRLLRLRKDGLEYGEKGMFGAEKSNFIGWDELKGVMTTDADSGNYVLRIDADWGEVFRLKAHELRSCIDEGLFLNAVRTWAPHAKINCSFAAQEDALSGQSFTQLWFKYFSAPTNRQRVALLEDGTQLGKGRYKIIGKLGTGGQGTAYLSVLPDSQGSEREVVLKEYILPVHRGTTVMEHTKEKLDREADILAAIDHPQIVKIFDRFFEDFRGYLVMEFVEGKVLKEMVDAEGPQPEKFVRELGAQICDILDYLHSLSPPVIHRDITPDNLILQPDGMLKLVDFNVAHELDASATSTVVGKQSYIPPEQFRGQATTQSDIYALGCTLFYLLTGQEPEPISTSHPKEIKPTLSDRIDRVVATATAPDARYRYASADEVKKDLLES